MGGAIFDNIGITLTNCRFIGNEANTKGGAYYVYMGKEPDVANCIFANNIAKHGGAIYNRGKMTMTNCNIVNNSAYEDYGGLLNEVKYSKFYNSIFWGNDVAGTPDQIEGECDLVNCAVEGGYAGTNIIDLSPLNNGSDGKAYPMFNDPDENDYELSTASPLINAGDNSASNMPDYDINYGWRIGQGTVDIGAYEYQGGLDLMEIDNENYHTIYPNPMQNTLNIEGDDNMVINIYNSLGQNVYSIECETNVNIDVSNWKAGLYIININGHYYKIIK